MIPVVLVHGFMGGRAQWAAQAAALGGQHPVLPIALPGFGDAAAAPALNRIRAFAEHAIAAVQARGIERFHLLGHSMGGMIVQEMVRLVPERIDRLVLYGTGAVGLLPGRFETIDESKARARTDGVTATARRIAATWFLDGTAAAAYPACADIAQQTAPAAFEGGLDAMQAWTGTDALPAIRARTLVLWGDGDRTYPWSQTERLWRGITGARLAVLPGCAHAVHMEKPDLFNRVVLDFMA